MREAERIFIQMSGKKKRLPIGIDSFEKLRSLDFYYVDKTGLIRELLNRWGEVNLFTRPRRFGKTLNMSMLKCFLEIGCDRSLFDGLEIAEDTKLCEQYMGKFPVISISLKGVNGADYAAARSLLCSVIGNEAMRFQFLLEDEGLTEREKRQYRQLVDVGTEGGESFAMSDSVLAGSLKTLSSLLEKHYGRKVILLIDEYDVPLSKANDRGYYGGMVLLIRNLFEQALKTNPSLYFAVLTGCLRVSKESIFTGLNNPKIFSIMDDDCDSGFGFTDEEVKEMLVSYELTDKYDQIREWYDGYLFGEARLYCPWDVINYVDRLQVKRNLSPQNYWSNTSGNDAVRHFIEKMGDGVMKGEIEALIAGETVSKEIHEDLTYNRLYDSPEHIWSLLFMTGYLTRRGSEEGAGLALTIPNMEIRSIFTRQIMDMFKEDVAKDGQLLRDFCAALESGNASKVEELFSAYLEKTVSIRDTFARKPLKENFYHGILLGILGYKNDWYVRSNKEAGDGYSDILIQTEDENTGIVIEMKYAETREFDTVCRKAVEQIDRNGYAEELRKNGCRRILKYGIACHKKQCQAMLEEEYPE